MRTEKRPQRRVVGHLEQLHERIAPAYMLPMTFYGPMYAAAPADTGTTATPPPYSTGTYVLPPQYGVGSGTYGPIYR
jgi:hypothetical protein